jgi:hypothetical protein
MKFAFELVGTLRRYGAQTTLIACHSASVRAGASESVRHRAVFICACPRLSALCPILSGQEPRFSADSCASRSR